MDKATKIAAEKYPHGTFDGEIGDSLRAACAIGYMQAAMNCSPGPYMKSLQEAVHDAIEQADELINQLKEGKA